VRALFCCAAVAFAGCGFKHGALGSTGDAPGGGACTTLAGARGGDQGFNGGAGGGGGLIGSTDGKDAQGAGGNAGGGGGGGAVGWIRLKSPTLQTGGALITPSAQMN